MKVKKLIKKLMKLDPDSIVVMASDAEGNKFSPLSDTTEELYFANNSWSGDIASEEDETHGADPAVVLWPTN